MSSEPDKRVWLGLSTTDTFIGRAIRWITNQPASHAWVSFWDESLERRVVMEASSSGYRVITWRRWLAEMQPKLKLWVFVTPHHDLTGGLHSVSSFLGTPYDLKALLWHSVGRWFRRWIKHPFTSPRKLYCSEAVVRILQDSVFPGAFRLNEEDTRPGDLLLYLEQSQYTERIEVDVP